MAKTIIEVEVDDSKFLNFKSVFDDYKKSLEDTPEAWNDANDEMSKMVQASQLLKNDAEKRLALLQAATLEETRAERAQKKTEEASRKASENRKKADLEMIKRWKEIGKTIAETTLNLTKFAALGSTSLSDFKFQNLVSSASAARFQSMGLGVSSGAMQAANINYSSALANPSANLAAVRDVQQDLSKQKLFATAGISNAQGKSITELLPELMVAAQKMAKQTPQGQLAQVSQAYGYSDVFSPEDLMRFKSMSEAEMTAMIAKTKEDEKALAVNNSTLKSYQDLMKQWDRFSRGIENILIKGLEPLAPALEGLSKAASNAFDKLMQSEQLGVVIDKLAAGITEFADYLTGKDAEEDFKAFVEHIKEAAAAVSSFVAFVKTITPENAKEAATTGAEVVGGGLLIGGLAKSVLTRIAGGAAATAATTAAAGAGGAAGAGLALPALALGATAYGSYKAGTAAYENMGGTAQEWIQKIMGNIMAFAGNDEAIAAQKQLANYAKSTEEELKKQKPMTAEQYKKTDLDNQSSLINGIKDAFKTAVTELKEVTGAAAGGEVSPEGDVAAYTGKKGDFDKKAAEYMPRLMKDLDLNINQAAAVMGNLGHESAGLVAGIQEGGVKKGRGGLGWAQWTGPRRRQFEAYLKETGQSASSDEANYQFFLKEAKGSESKGIEAVKKAQDVKGGVYKFERGFERSGDVDEHGNIIKAGHYQSRYNYAARALAAAQGGAPISIDGSQAKGKPFVTGRGEKDIHGKVKVKDSYALRKPTADQQKSVMFQDQGGLYNSNASRVTINLNNATGGSATASAVSL